MRDAFAKEIKILAEEKDNVILLSGDIGNRMFDGLKDSRPEQFINSSFVQKISPFSGTIFSIFSFDADTVGTVLILT